MSHYQREVAEANATWARLNAAKASVQQQYIKNPVQKMVIMTETNNAVINTQTQVEQQVKRQTGCLHQ